MENRWADPAGSDAEPTRVRYQIKDGSGTVVERITSVAYDSKRQRYFHSLAAFDQQFADELVDIIQSACAYFYATDHEYEPIEGIPDIRVSDGDVRERIARLEQGENVREAERTGLEYYPLAELPFDQQRALVERIEDHKQRWAFEILGEEAKAAA